MMILPTGQAHVHRRRLHADRPSVSDTYTPQQRMPELAVKSKCVCVAMLHDSERCAASNERLHSMPCRSRRDGLLL